ncbi:MAG: hypothetical protein JSU86_10770 [Phycisphaerales bacterium]|nr:MAG: hypothetical protein JSU86_10770 [Phycisphaerales bacterium]
MGKTKAPSRKEGPGVNPSIADAARRLFDVVRIVDVRLVECRAYLRGDTPRPLLLSTRRDARGSRSPDGRQACAQVRFTLEGRPDENGKKDADLFIEATFSAMYDIPKDLEASDDALDFFAHTNGTFNLWPYWREFVQTMANRMGVPGLTVPTYRIEEAFSGPGSADRTQQGRTPRTRRK